MAVEDDTMSDVKNIQNTAKASDSKTDGESRLFKLDTLKKEMKKHDNNPWGKFEHFCQKFSKNQLCEVHFHEGKVSDVKKLLL